MIGKQTPIGYAGISTPYPIFSNTLFGCATLFVALTIHLRFGFYCVGMRLCSDHSMYTLEYFHLKEFVQKKKNPIQTTRMGSETYPKIFGNPPLSISLNMVLWRLVNGGILVINTYSVPYISRIWSAISS